MKLKNPLDIFRSHSIHYVMLGARSTSDLQVFNENAVDGSQSRAYNAINDAKYLGDQISLDGKSAYLLMDTRRFSQFTITDFKMKNTISSMTDDGGISPNSVFGDLAFTVLDPMGVLFSNFLQFVLDRKLQVSFEGMSVLIRILFVGHKEDGTSETIQTVSIPCGFLKIELDITNTGGVYTCTMFPMTGNNAMGRNAKWVNIGTASNFFTGENKNTLGAMVSSFESNLNTQSLNMFNSVNKGNAGNNFGRLVQYMITLPKGWAEFTFTGPTQGKVEETSFVAKIKQAEQKQTADAKSEKEKQYAELVERQQKTNELVPAKESFLAVSPSMSIMQVLDIIFSQTVEVAKLANFTRSQNEQGMIVYYKYLVSITSDDDSFTVHVDVVEFVVPNVMLVANHNGAIESASLFTKSEENGKTKTVPKNSLEFDYIYSGTNVDVLSLSLKIEDLNYMLSSPERMGQRELLRDSTTKGQSQTDKTGSTQDAKPLTNKHRPKDPILIADRTWGDNNNFSNVASNVAIPNANAIHQEYIKNLASYYNNGGSWEGTMEIRGNPIILAAATTSAIPTHVKSVSTGPDGKAQSNLTDSQRQEYRTEFDAKLASYNNINTSPDGKVHAEQFTGKSSISTPMYVKVNVYGPSTSATSDSNFATHEVDPEVDFSRLIFDDNYYICRTIESHIAGATFKQVMELGVFSVFGATTRQTKEGS